MPGGAGFLNHQQYELFPCPEKEFTVFVDLCASFDSGMTRKKTSGMTKKRNTEKKHGRVNISLDVLKKDICPHKIRSL